MAFAQYPFGYAPFASSQIESPNELVETTGVEASAELGTVTLVTNQILTYSSSTHTHKNEEQPKQGCAARMVGIAGLWATKISKNKKNSTALFIVFPRLFVVVFLLPFGAGGNLKT